MAILKHEDLLLQAEELVRGSRWPKQVNVRRAISAAYYGVFHFLCPQAADFSISIGKGRNNEPHPFYCLAYRSIDHAQLRRMCQAVKSQWLETNVQLESSGYRFSQELLEFASIVERLQKERNRADYDPAMMLTAADVRIAVASARRSIKLFENVHLVQKQSVLALLLFKQR